MADEKVTKKPTIAEKIAMDRKAEEAAIDGSSNTSAKTTKIKAFISKQNKTVMIIAGLVALSFIAGILYFIFKPSTNVEVEKPVETPIFFDLPEITTSIPKANGKSGFLIVSFTLQLEKENDREIITKLQPTIIDAIQVYISSLRLNTLSTDSGISLISPLGLEKVRNNLILRINAVIAPIKITTALYRKFVAQ